MYKEIETYKNVDSFIEAHQGLGICYAVNIIN